MPTLSVDRVLEIVTEETIAAGGTVSDQVRDDRRMYLRTRLRHREPIREGDEIEGGIALRMDGAEVCIRPYAFRLICANGAILPALADSDVIDLTLMPIEVQEERLCEAIRDCGRHVHFGDFMEGARNLLDPMAMVMMHQHLMHLPDELVLQIIAQAHSDGDTSAYGLWNAVTALARGQESPEQRWRLEEIGGQIPAWILQNGFDREWGEELELPFEREAMVPA